MGKIKIGIAGLGTVGRGVYEILQKDAKLLTARTGAEFEVTAVSARSKKDFIDSKVHFVENSVELANSDVDVVVEAIGGTTIAKELVEKSLKNGKKVITANKALLAEFGSELAEIAEKNNGFLAYEAAIAAAIPVVKLFREGLAANEIKEFYGILNGTSNFILTKMKQDGLTFEKALKLAQDLGYAEADPAFDINGTDAAHKLTLLAAISSATKPDFKNVFIEGIEKITILDIKAAEELGYSIKLLGIYKNLGDSIQASVYPALVDSSKMIAQINRSLNTIVTSNSNAGWSMISGVGAGSLPTASAIVADLVDAARDNKTPIFGTESRNLTSKKIIDIKNRRGKYFIISESSDVSDQIECEKQTMLNVDGKEYHAFITKECEESSLLQNLKNVKFLRVENNLEQ